MDGAPRCLRIAYAVVVSLLVVGAALSGCGGDEDPRSGSAPALQQLAVNSDGAIVMAGVSANCGSLEIRVIDRGAATRALRVDADKLGMKCPDRVTDAVSTDEGIDISVGGSDDDGSLFESTQVTDHAVVRLTDDGELDDEFGDAGVATSVDGSTAALPGGGLAGPNGARYDTSGKATDPLDFVPGTGAVAAAKDGTLFEAGEPRQLAERGKLRVAHLTERGTLIRDYGEDGVASLAIGPVDQLLPLPDDSVVVADLYGQVARLDSRGQIVGTIRIPFATPTRGPRAPSGEVDQTLASDPQGALAVVRSIGDGRVSLLRVRPDGKASRRFGLRQIRLPKSARRIGGLDVAVTTDDRTVALVDPAGPSRPFVVAFDRAGKRVAPIQGSNLRLLPD